jgi:hypothetical protein
MRKLCLCALLWMLRPPELATTASVRKFKAEDFTLDWRPEVQLDVHAELLRPLTAVMDAFNRTYPNVSRTLFDLRSDLPAHRVFLNRSIAEIDHAVSVLDLEGLAEAKYPGQGRGFLPHRLIWPDVVLYALDRIGLLHLEGQRANAYPSGHWKTMDGELHVLDLIAKNAHIVRHSRRDSDAHSFALQHASQAFITLRQQCDGVELLKNIVALRGGDLLRAMSRMEDFSREHFAIASQYCEPHLSAQVFRILIAMHHFDPSRPLHHCPKRSCWPAHDLVLRLVGQHEAADSFFTAHLKPHVEWRHAAQMPTEFNSLFATARPHPFVDVAQHRVAQRLIAARESIAAEFFRYELRVATGHTQSLFDPNHVDSYPIEGAEGYRDGAWEYLTLKQDGRWNQGLCDRHFPLTCDLVRGLREVDEQFQPGRDECEGYCSQHYGAGFTSFYRLAPGVSVPLHAGLTNARIKCQLVIRAPAKGPYGASITVGGVTKKVAAGDVYCFDDSFVHTTHNGGGVNSDIFRVVFDVSLLHPGMWDSDLRQLAAENSTLEEGAEPHASGYNGLNEPSGGTGEAFGRW